VETYLGAKAMSSTFGSSLLRFAQSWCSARSLMGILRLSFSNLLRKLSADEIVHRSMSHKIIK
jgi:hypothetical protein